MPRCQWCRQDSQSADVCDWCKRPLGFAGSAPAAVPHGVAVANQMTFQDSSGGSNDRLLMFSMLGVVGMTLLAFLFSFLNRPSEKTVVPPAPAPIVVEQAPRPEGGSGASPVAPMPEAPAPQMPAPQQVAELPPPTYTPPPAVEQPVPRATGQRFGGNRKLGIAVEGTSPQ